MQTQNYSNHIRIYTTHHLIFYPLTFLCGIIISCLIFKGDNSLIWIGILSLLILIFFLSFMMRQHYALTLQNRIVRMELRLRYYIITQKRFEEIENKLNENQIFALRFASDGELEVLIQKTLTDNLDAKNIKKSIQNWLPDNARV